eukprot:sb/3463494/
MAQSFTAEFSVYMETPSSEHYSDKKLLHGFLWSTMVRTEDPCFFGLFLCCESENSTNGWRCSTKFSLESTELGTPKQMEGSVDFSVTGGWPPNRGWVQFMKRDERKRIDVTAVVTINSTSTGDSPLKPMLPAKSSPVMFQRRLNIGSLNNNVFYTSHTAHGKTWLAHIQKLDSFKLKFKIECYNTQTGALESLKCAALMVIKESTNFKQTRCLGEFFNFNLNPDVRSTVDVTFIIDHESYDGVDFGREYLSLPAHGNNSMLLRDDTSIPLNSYILARNSPILKNLIEEEGEIDHDVSDFEPEAVRIFIDACYSGVLDKLDESTEFMVFSDFVKMIAVFKVDWAKDGCLEFYKKRLPKPTDDFTAYWNYALLALDTMLKHADASLLDYFLSCTPENKLKFQFRLPQLIAETTKRAHLDLLMVVVVQYDLTGEFINQMLAVLMLKNHIPLLIYWLENFNFLLCDKDVLPLLAEAVEQNTNADLCCEFIALLKKEREGEDEENIELNPVDGTLATLARNNWINMLDSTWPCSGKRPFSMTSRNLQKSVIEEELEEEEKSATSHTLGC